NGAGLAVGVGVGLVRIEHLDLELAHEEHAAVAAVLARSPGGFGCGPLDVELDVAERRLGLDPPCAGRGFHGAVTDPPLRGAAVRRLPGVEARAIEQDDRILGRLDADLAVGRLDDRWLRAADVVLPPAGSLAVYADLVGGQVSQDAGGGK